MIYKAIKVYHLGPIRSVQSRKLQMAEATLADPTGTIKIVLWEEFAGQVVNGQTYMFNNVRVKKDKITHEVYVNTAKTESEVTQTIKQIISHPAPSAGGHMYYLNITTTKLL